MANEKSNQDGIVEVLQKILMDEKLPRAHRDLALYILADSDERVISLLSVVTVILSMNLSTLSAINTAALRCRGIMILDLMDEDI